MRNGMSIRGINVAVLAGAPESPGGIAAGW